MAQIIRNDKGYKIIWMQTTELVKKLGESGSVGLCDLCGKADYEWFYVAALNRFLCPDCYEDWYKRVLPRKEDNPIEEHNFNYYKKLFKL